MTISNPELPSSSTFPSTVNPAPYPYVVAVAGGRNYVDGGDTIFEALDSLVPRPDLVVHGDCHSGADIYVTRWCMTRGVALAKYPALWEAHGKSAGPRRTKWMLQFARPALLVVFHGGSGTAAAVEIAGRLGIPVKDLRGVSA